MAKKDKPTRRTPRRNTAQLSKEVQARLSAFVNSYTEGFALLDENLNYMVINPVAERMIGVSREAVVGKNVLDVVPDVKESRRYDKYMNVLETGEPFHIEDMVSHTKFRDIHASLKAFRVGNWLGLVFTDITERKQAEETLRQGEQNYRVLFEGTLDGLFVVNAETGRIVLANRTAAKMFGFDSPEDMIGVDPINPFTPKDRNGVLRFVAEYVLKDLSEEGLRSNREAHEIRALANDGREIWLEIQGTPTEYQGKLAYLVSNRDITERKRIEEQERRHSHDLDLLCKAAMSLVELHSDADIHRFIAERLQKFAEGAAVLVNSCDETSDTFCVREALGIGEQMEALTKILGFNLIGMPVPIGDEARQGLSSSELAKVQGGIYDLASGAIPMPVCQEIEKLLDVGNVYAIGFAWEGRLYGSAVIFTRNGTELRNKDVIETFVRQASIALQRRQAEEALKESEEKYRALIEATGRAGEGIIIIQDREEREAAFVFVNDEFCRMSGYSRKELLNRSAWDLVPYEIAVRLKDWYKLRHMGEALPGHYEAAGVRKDGTIVPLDLSVVTMPWQGKIATVLYMRDITERKRMEDALRKSEQTIRQLAKASTSAHEEERQRVSLEVHDRISQTLTGAFHQLQALEAIPIENTGAQQILKRASDLLQESIRESRNIIEDLYSPVLSDFGIVAVIDEELRRFQEETGCRTKFDKRFAVRPTPDVELTAYRIFREVLANIKRHAIGASEVKVSFSCEAGVVSLQVKDNGPGFDVEAALQNMRMGGLKGMQRRAELGGGTCEVISSRGHGTTVTVRLPYSSETPAANTGKEEKTT